LNLALWKASGDTKYLTMAEKATFNELAFNQFTTGDFGHRVYTETGLPAAGAARAWWCCTLHGLRCFPDVQENAFRATDGTVRYEMPLNGRIETGTLTASAESTIAQNGMVKIRIEKAGEGRTKLAVRKPEWAEAVTLHLKGPGLTASPEPGYVEAVRAWSAGEVIEVQYKMRWRSEPSGEGRESFWYGPWLLGVSAVQNPAYFNELTTQNRLTEGAEQVIGKKEMASQFSIPIAASEMRYTQAEYPVQPAKVALRPIAEQTGLPTTPWEVRFLVRKQG
jgi:DUF1680 family protein